VKWRANPKDGGVGVGDDRWARCWRLRLHRSIEDSSETDAGLSRESSEPMRNSHGLNGTLGRAPDYREGYLRSGSSTTSFSNETSPSGTDLDTTGTEGASVDQYDPVQALAVARRALSKARSDRERAAKSSQATGWTLAVLAVDPEAEVRAAVGGNPRSPLVVLEHLYQDSEEVVRKAVGANPSSSEEILSKLFKDPSLQVRVSVSSNPSLPLELQEVASQAAEAEIRCAVARNPSARPEILDFLASDPSWRVRAAVAAASELPVSAQEHLAWDDVSAIRVALAANPSAVEAVLEHLALDSEGAVRLAVVDNPQASAQVKELAREYDASRRNELMTGSLHPTSEEDEEDSEEAQLKHERLLASNRFSPPEALDALAKSPNWVIRQAIALNPASSEHTLDVLSRDSNPAVRRAVASSRKAADYTLERLAGDKDREVRQAVANNPAASPKVVEKALDALGRM